MSDESPIQAKLSLSDQSIKPVVDAVADIFSPATELLGWLGDSIRVHRIRAAMKCFHLTKELALEQNLHLKTPPIKFLTQYIENCSIEDDEDEQLIEWWARLLVDAGKNFNNKHIFYTNVIKQLTGFELEALEI